VSALATSDFIAGADRSSGSGSKLGVDDSSHCNGNWIAPGRVSPRQVTTGGKPTGTATRFPASTDVLENDGTRNLTCFYLSSETPET